jgi:hypothetical protein
MLNYLIIEGEQMKKIKKTLSVIFALTMLLCSAAAILPRAGQACDEEKIYARGANLISINNETINYAYRTTTLYIIPNEMTTFLSSYSCGITAGGNLINYYNRQFPQLIPGHSSGRIFLGNWVWYGQNNIIRDMYDDLYVRMNGTPLGVTNAGYRAGLTSYAASKGRTMTYQSSMTGSNLNNTYKTALLDNKIVSIFVDGYNIISPGSFTTSQGADVLQIWIYGGAHIMVAYGFYEVKYFNSSNINFRTDNYLLVGTGFSQPGRGFLRLNQNVTIDDCFVSHII